MSTSDPRRVTDERRRQLIADSMPTGFSATRLVRLTPAQIDKIREIVGEYRLDVLSGSRTGFEYGPEEELIETQEILDALVEQS